MVDKNLKPISGVNVYLWGTELETTTDNSGLFTFTRLSNGHYHLLLYKHGFQQQKKDFTLKGDTISFVFTLKPIEKQLQELVVEEKKSNDFGISYMNSVQNMGIYAAKKNELILLENCEGNKSVNNARQIYAKVSGVNIWESDGAGLQLGIGARGLNPNRSSNFNTRQHGYDISADALGYPESYYTPPVEALDRIEVIRGSASLQYGTQFGGVLNFVFKEPSGNKKLEGNIRQSVGSFGLSNTFVSLRGKHKSVSYSSFFQYKRGNGWRDNSDFNATMAFVKVENGFSENFSMSLEYTYMTYLAQQAGGITDKQFNANPRFSSRERNWFSVNWNLAALLMDYKINSNTKLNSRFFGLHASRNALGELGRIDRPDPLDNRDLISGNFQNIGNETRFLKNYTLSNGLPSTVLLGFRLYRGHTTSLQGEANSNDDANFNFLNSNDLLSNYTFDNYNVSLFVENIFKITSQFSLTPGFRYEYINTGSVGTFNADVLHPNTAEVLLEIDLQENKTAFRNIYLAGLGAGFKPTENIEVYTNFSQNYRAINFSDIKIVNPNFKVDTDIQDENGWNLGLGLRGKHKNHLQFDVSGFYLQYNNRIGAVLKNDSISFQTYRLRTNVGNSRNVGLESFFEIDFFKWWMPQFKKMGLSVYSNLSVINAQYTTSLDPAIKKGNKVEYVPSTNWKTGMSFSFEKAKISYQYTYVSSQFTEATNAVKPLPSAVDGLIPAYYVMDLAFSYSYKKFGIETGVNNLSNHYYFTRRATAYPGPGIIPSNGRSFYFTLEYRF